MPDPATSMARSACLAGQRVLVVFESLELGGAERQGLLLARHLRDTYQADVLVLGFHGPGRAADLCDAHGIPWRVIPFPLPRGGIHCVRLLSRLAWQVAALRPRVILPYTNLPNLAMGAIWRFTGALRCIWNQRDEGRDLDARSLLLNWAVGCTPRFIANSEHGALFLREVLRAPAHRISVVRNGVSPPAPELDASAWRERLGVSPHTSLACMVANIHAYKDHATLIDAWRLVRDRWDAGRPAPVLLLAGRFHEITESLRQQAARLGVGEFVRFLGKVDDISGLLAACDLGVFSSRHEGCPNGVLECMAAGLAVAATDIPGIREAVGEAGQPFLAPAGDADGFADNIVMLLRDPALRHRLGQANRQRIAEEFSPARMVDETVAAICASPRL